MSKLKIAGNSILMFSQSQPHKYLQRLHKTGTHWKLKQRKFVRNSHVLTKKKFVSSLNTVKQHSLLNLNALPVALLWLPRVVMTKTIWRSTILWQNSEAIPHQQLCKDENRKNVSTNNFPAKIMSLYKCELNRTRVKQAEKLSKHVTY